MNDLTRRGLALTHLRAFEAVARKLNFSAAAAELFLTQSAVSRQIKALEDELGSALFVRGTRRVALTSHGQTLLRAVEASVPKIDAAVRQIRSAGGRKRVNVTTFASFGSMWLLPRIEAFQRDHPDIDIRVSAEDALVDLDDPELDLALRYSAPGPSVAGASRLFGEVLTPVVSRLLAERVQGGNAPPLAVPADLAQHTLAEEDDGRTSSQLLSWRRWLTLHGEPALQPRRWLYLNFTYQQVQAALSGHGVALARIALVFEALQRGELIEPFGLQGRIHSPSAYWLLVGPGRADRPEVARFRDWVLAQAVETRRALGEIENETETETETAARVVAADP
ncbi:MAG: LysR substrate-binding domain-containing protein [Pseudomonadota bacterium]|nr:LysR substrate-binding domain-containing protein [Pseudomonadota bacterium]